MRIMGLSLILAGALMASEYSYEISPMIGGVKPEGNLDIDSQKAWGARFQMNDWDLLGLVPELSFDRTTSTDYEYNAGSTTINRYAFNGLYDFEDFSDTVTPYVLIGLGYEDVREEKLGYDNSVYGNYGAGLKMKVYEDIALRAELKHLIRTDDGGNELYYGIGLSIPFGKKASEQPMEEKEEEVAPVVAVVLDGDKDGVLDNIDKCPTTPAGRTVNAQGCELDGDKDGVVDALDKCPTTPAGRTVNAQGCELDGDKDGVVDALDKCPNTKVGNTVDVNGCSESVVLAITFENASAKIDLANSPQLKKYADFMKLNTEYDVTIIGHTDSRGSAAFNKTLSTKRAVSVKNNLVSRGVEASRIQTLGRGEEEPIADNATAEGRAKNRRIEVQLSLQK
jgi:OOP family OmpA-OmpF porin